MDTNLFVNPLACLCVLKRIDNHPLGDMYRSFMSNSEALLWNREGIKSTARLPFLRVYLFIEIT